MPKNNPFSATDSGHAKAPDFSIPDAAAKHNIAAARPHRKAAKRYTGQPRADCPPLPTGAPAKPYERRDVR